VLVSCGSAEVLDVSGAEASSGLSFCPSVSRTIVFWGSLDAPLPGVSTGCDLSVPGGRVG
jgi:hypothetical protein